HPALQCMLAGELALDAQSHARAELLLRRVIARAPLDASGYTGLGLLAWRRQRRDEALELFRFAACLAPRSEELALRYFHACRHLGQQELGLAFLQARVSSLGATSGMPAITLHDALEAVGRSADAREVLDAALRARPGDAELALAAAHAF